MWDPDEQVECYLSETEVRWTRPTKSGGGYMVVAFDEDYIEGAENALQHVQPWFINDDLREVISNYYKTKTVKGITVVSKEGTSETDEDENTDEEAETALLESQGLPTTTKAARRKYSKTGRKLL